jgi:hypothetical protein
VKSVKVSMCREVIAFKYLGQLSRKVGRHSRTGLSGRKQALGAKGQASKRLAHSVKRSDPKQRKVCTHSTCTP